MTRQVEADYLIVGAGAAGMAVCDELLSHSNATIAIVDRRHAPGGHWQEAYPFVRLHQPSWFYGVSSLPLGDDKIDESGTNAGFYELAGPDELRAYFERVMHRVFLPSGRVRYFPLCDYTGDRQFVSRASGETWSVDVHRRIVDTTYVEGNFPATSPPPFDVDDGVWCVPVGEIARLDKMPERYVIIGAGKTALDAAVWLIEKGVQPERISWIKPRETWWLNRKFQQPHTLFPDFLLGMVMQLETMTQATSLDELFESLEAQDIFLRVDTQVEPTMFRGAVISKPELDLLRQIEDVVRMGHVQRIKRDAIVLEGGRIPTNDRTVHVHCASSGLGHVKPRPIFDGESLTTQPFQWGFASYQAATLAVVEATVDNDEQRNQLCRPMAYWDMREDYLRAFRALLLGQQARRAHEQLSRWDATTRLNPMSGAIAFRDDPEVSALRERVRNAAGTAVVNINRLLGS